MYASHIILELYPLRNNS